MTLNYANSFNKIFTEKTITWLAFIVTHVSNSSGNIGSVKIAFITGNFLYNIPLMSPEKTISN